MNTLRKCIHILRHAGIVAKMILSTIKYSANALYFHMIHVKIILLDLSIKHISQHDYIVKCRKYFNGKFP